MFFDRSSSSSPSSSSPSMPIPIAGSGRTSSPTDSVLSFQRQSSTSPSHSAACAYPSWPTGGTFEKHTIPSSFISDEDLLFDDLAEGGVATLTEPPPPPRDVYTAQALPLLPLYASEKPKTRRRSTKTKVRRSSKPMTPISESPETPE